jgi:acyl-CoA synthetase (AMP-forming)/AMP-acid ligase II
MTFAQLEAGAWRGAARLTSVGLKPGDRVLVFAANSPDWIVGFWSVALAGCVNVLGNCWWSTEEIAHAVGLTRPTAVLTDDWTSPRSPQTIMELPIAELAAHADRAVAPPPTGERDPAVVIFTSGTTGASKGAVLSHRALIALQHTLLHVTGLLADGHVRERPPDVTLQTAPLFHVGGVQAMLRSLVTGSTMVVPAGRFDPALVLETIEREKVQRWGAVPTMVSRVLEHPDIRLRDVGSLRSISVGGSPVPTALVRRMRAAFANTRSGVGTIYGLTEAGGTLTAASGRDLAERPGTVGRPLPLAEIRIACPDRDGVGEILARTPTQMDGYWGGRDDAIDAEGWIHTGDVGRLDADGYLYVTGRSKEVIIRGGENIACNHVEDQLLAHPDVLECAVLGQPHDDLGEEVAVAVVLRPGAAVNTNGLADFLRDRLAYFEIPSRWWLRDLPLPCNDTGKVDKRLLAATWPSTCPRP